MLGILMLVLLETHQLVLKDNVMVVFIQKFDAKEITYGAIHFSKEMEFKEGMELE